MKPRVSSAGRPSKGAKSSARGDSLVSIIEESQIYQNYREAFTRATGLPLQIRASLDFGEKTGRKANAFCALMARSNQACAACYAMQQKLEQEAGLEPRTLKCFAGLCETAVPVRVGENLIAFLETGQVLLSRPSAARFNKLARTLIQWGTEIDLKQAEEAYFNIRVLPPKQYAAMVRLLETFAEHLAVCGQHLALKAGTAEPPAIGRAREWIARNSDEDLSLALAARAVNMSAKYFSEMFRKATGIPFVEYVARVRVEKAKNLLLNPHRRVADIAFEIGFQSLSQFNRSFKKLTGRSPRDFRTG